MSEQQIDYESEARSQGWRPVEEWKGDPDKWKTAEKFVEDGKNILPLVQSKNRELQERLDDFQTRLDEMSATNKEFGEFSRRALDKEKREKEQLRTELEQTRKQAVTEGDGDAFDAADRQLRELSESETPNNGQSLPPGGQEFLARNDWFDKDETLTAFANGIADKIAAQGYMGPAYFKELENRVKKAFPEKFENPNKSSPPAVEGDGTKSVASKSKSFDDLPPDAQAACKRFVSDIPDSRRKITLKPMSGSEFNA